jgi:hypothetical protein
MKVERGGKGGDGEVNVFGVLGSRGDGGDRELLNGILHCPKKGCSLGER